MTLQNLAKIGQLKPHAATPEEVQRLLAAAARNLRDAARQENSDEARFDCANKAIMQCALVAMLASAQRRHRGPTVAATHPTRRSARMR